MILTMVPHKGSANGNTTASQDPGLRHTQGKKAAACTGYQPRSMTMKHPTLIFKTVPHSRSSCSLQVAYGFWLFLFWGSVCDPRIVLDVDVDRSAANLGQEFSGPGFS